MPLEPARTRASMRTTVIFATSDGWPIRRPPMVSQLWELAALPAPLPSKHEERCEHDSA